MKNIIKWIVSTIAIFVLFVGTSQSQTYTDSWSIGFGGLYPKLFDTEINSLNSNYGAYLFLQANTSEHVAFRLKGSYSHMEGEWFDAKSTSQLTQINLITTNADILYYFVPCEWISPYLFGGVGANWKLDLENSQTPNIPDKARAELDAGFGLDMKLSDDWAINGEFAYHLTNNSDLDGAITSNLEQRDAYITLNAGVKYIFSHGADSKQCPVYDGIEAQDLTDYDRIEDMIIKHSKEVVKTILIDTCFEKLTDDEIILNGVNFDFDKSTLLPESYVVLDKVVDILNKNKNIQIEIRGYADATGTNEYNQKLSERRAVAVRDYLVSKGIASSRLTPVGYGERNPIESNDTEEGRAANRRMTFKIK